ncbi:MAG TPA: hypothetical protein ACFYD4_13770 [Candidatus Wunengus sp. YC61]|uniref:hypothetical protein n=1 Tax=Candidatus Wunengus sp. YC61 TaxID=3367698 RepID=UPI004028EF3C
MIKPVLVKCLKVVIYCLQVIGTILYRNRSVVLFRQNVSDEIVDEIRRRLHFYVPTKSDRVREVRGSFSFRLFTTEPLLVIGASEGIAKFLILYRRNTYYVDHTRNPGDGGAWCRLSMKYGSSTFDLHAAHKVFVDYVNELQLKGYKRVYLFGTGPSLAKAINYPWDDGYRVVCNTIVRDKELWHHINPHFIVAGDAIYHFGFTTFAKKFREDLKKRLLETDTRFLYPSLFHEIVSRDFSEVSDKLIPIPIGTYRCIHNDLRKNFSLPNIGNVLSLLLLPLGCTLAKDVCLWGFDGRAPEDKLFWSNSSKHSYPEHMDELRGAHPAFFSHHVPESDPTKYVKEVHGDTLDINLTLAEREGWRFRMLHDSFTPTLQKRRADR